MLSPCGVYPQTLPVVLLLWRGLSLHCALIDAVKRMDFGRFLSSSRAQAKKILRGFRGFEFLNENTGSRRRNIPSTDGSLRRWVSKAELWIDQLKQICTDLFRQEFSSPLLQESKIMWHAIRQCSVQCRMKKQENKEGRKNQGKSSLPLSGNNFGLEQALFISTSFPNREGATPAQDYFVWVRHNPLRKEGLLSQAR